MTQSPTARLVLAVPAGAGITLSVLLLMTALLARSPIDIADRDRRGTLAFLPEPVETPPVPTEPVIDRIPPPLELPETQLTDGRTESAPAIVRVPATRPGPMAATTLGAPGDSPLVAMLRVEPAYPPGAAARGLEGYVVVEFTVRADGTTADILVLESSHSIFERAAIRAAERFRYRPRTLDGRAQAVPGVQNRFRFQMKD